MIRRLGALLLAVCALSSSLNAHTIGVDRWPRPPADVGQTARISLTDGSEIKGNVLEVTDDTIALTLDGTNTVRRVRLREVDLVEVLRSYKSRWVLSSLASLAWPAAMIATTHYNSSSDRVKAGFAGLGLAAAMGSIVAAVPPGLKWGSLDWKTTYERQP